MKNVIQWTSNANKQLMRIDQRNITKIIEKVESLRDFPDVKADIKDLKGKLYEKQYRLRVGNYRIIFEVIDGSPRIIEIQAVKRRTDRTYN